MKLYFFNIIDWLYSVGAQFGVSHVVIGSKVYWLDIKADRDELYKLYKNKE